VSLKRSIKSGFGFGLTSGIITTLGLIIGLYSGAQSRKVIIGGILTIAVADALSDALGIHIAEESKKHPTIEIWEATLSTLFSKFLFAISFLVPMLIFSLKQAIVVSIAWGLILLTVFSIYVANEREVNPWKVVMEHISIAVLVIILTYYVGIFIGHNFS